MPTLNDALQLRTLWNSSADLLMSRLLQLDRLSERIGLGGSITDEFVAHNGTVEQWKSFLNTLLCSKPIDSPTFLRSESKDTTGKLACSF